MSHGLGRFGVTAPPSSGGGSVSYPISIANGGTGQTTGPAALRALAGSQALSISTGTVAVDCSLGLFCTLTVSANCTISNPTNASAGDMLTFVITQNGTGGYWVDWGSAFEKPAVWSGANQVTTHRFVYDGTTWRVTSRALSRAVGSDTSTSDITTGVECAGSSFVPVPSGVYRYEYTIAFVNAGGTGSGTQFRMESGNAVNGTANSMSPTAATSVALSPGGLTEESWVLGLGSRGATVQTPATMSGILQAHASAPTAVSLWMRSETANSATVSGNTVLSITRVA